MRTPRVAAPRLSQAEAETLLTGLMRMDAAAAEEFIGRHLARAQSTLEVHLVDTDPEQGDRLPGQDELGGGFRARLARRAATDGGIV